MTEQEKTELGETFVHILNEMGITNIQDIPSGTVHAPKEHTEVWIIKG